MVLNRRWMNKVVVIALIYLKLVSCVLLACISKLDTHTPVAGKLPGCSALFSPLGGTVHPSCATVGVLESFSHLCMQAFFVLICSCFCICIAQCKIKEWASRAHNNIPIMCHADEHNTSFTKQALKLRATTYNHCMFPKP